MSLQERILESLARGPLSYQALRASLTPPTVWQLDAALKCLKTQAKIVCELGYYRMMGAAPVDSPAPKAVPADSRPVKSFPSQRRYRGRPGGSLTHREHEVAEMAVAGRSNSQIAAVLGIRIGTVTDHLRNVYAKLGVRGREELEGRVGKKEGAHG